MTRKNDLLEKDINQAIGQLRHEEKPKKKVKKPLFYVIVVCLVTLAALLSLLRYL